MAQGRYPGVQQSATTTSTDWPAPPSAPLPLPLLWLAARGTRSSCQGVCTTNLRGRAQKG